MSLNKLNNNKILTVALILLLGFLVVPLASAGFGDPKLEITVSATSPLKWKEYGSLDVSIINIGDDWAKSVSVSVEVPQNSRITVSPPEAFLTHRLDPNYKITYSFKIYVPENEPEGLKTLKVVVRYADTGWFDVGVWWYNVTKYVNLHVLKPPARLYIESYPSGAYVYINGIYKGTTPLNLELDPGTYSIRIEKSGYRTEYETVTLSPGDTRSIFKDLEPLKAKLYVHSNPSSASVYIDGIYKGITPLTLELDPGTYSIRIEKSGYRTEYETVTLSPGDTRTVSKSLILIATPTPTPTRTPPPPRGPPGDLVFLGFIILIAILGSIIVALRKPKEHEPEKSGIEYEKTKPKTQIAGEIPAEKIEPKAGDKVPGFPEELLAKYEPIEFLGEGGFAKVFKVRRKTDGKTIALKVLTKEKRVTDTLTNEVAAWLSLDHENIAKLYGVSKDPVPHMEVELAEGVKIGDKVVRDLGYLPKPLDEKMTIRLIRGIAEGLKHAHSKNIFHRDLKPQNVLLSADFKPKITDWGLAKVKTSSTSATSSKAFTLQYAAPEQLDSKLYGPTDQRTDIFQLGLIFYELLTGRLPFEAESPYQIMSSILNPNPFDPISKHSIELSKFDAIISKMLAKKKEERFQSMDEFISALDILEKNSLRIEELEKSFEKSLDDLKKSKTSEEVKKYKRLAVEILERLSKYQIEIGNIVGLRKALHDLRPFAGEKQKELDNAIKQLDYCIENEIIPSSEDFKKKLEALLQEIKRGVD